MFVVIPDPQRARSLALSFSHFLRDEADCVGGMIILTITQTNASRKDRGKRNSKVKKDGDESRSERRGE